MVLDRLQKKSVVMQSRKHLVFPVLGLSWVAQVEGVARDSSGNEALHEQDILEGKSTTHVPHAGNKPSVFYKCGKEWHFDIGVRSHHPRLQETRDVLRERLDAPLKLDFAHVFSQPYTPIDRNTDWGCGSGFLGFGRQQSDWLIWNVHAGGSWGEDRNFSRFLVTSLGVNFKYQSFYVGGDIEIYPWKVPEVRPEMKIGERLRASRPFILTGIEAGYVRADCQGAFRIFRLPVYRDEEHVRDWIGNYFIGLGWSVPLSDSVSWNIAGDYAFNFYRANEFNSWNLITGLRFRF